MITWIFFDLDETLLDHRTASQWAAGQLYRGYAASVPYSEEQFIARWRRSSEKYFDMYLGGEIDWITHGRLRIREALASAGSALSDVEADAAFAAYVQAYEENWLLFPDALSCLQQLHGQNLGVITNGTAWQQKDKLRRTGIRDRFQVVVVSEAAGHAKPDPRIFLHACTRAGAEPAQCVYVGDRLQTDALAARRAGMRGVWLNREGPTDEAATAVDVIGSLSELPALLKRQPT